MWTRARLWATSLIRRARFEDELAEELEFHLQARVRHWEQQGLGRDDARRRARLEFGRTDLIKDDCRAAWGVRQVDTLVQDVRYALRRARRAPGLMAVTVLTIALGIGATTAVFSVVDAVLVRPLPYGEPSRLVALWPGQAMSYAQLIFLQERTRVLEAIASVAGWTVAFTETASPTRLSVEKVSANVFDVLDALPLVGRSFEAREWRPGADKVVVLSYPFWQGRFGADPDVVGRAMVIDGTAHQIIGVMRPGFQIFNAGADLWMPLALDPDAWYHDSGVSRLIARLEPGQPLESAQREFRALVGELREEFDRPDEYGRDATVVPLHDAIVGEVEPPLLVLQGTALFILLIAAANVTHLLLVQAVGRGREMAIRAAVGGGTRRVLAQLVVENALLFTAGGLLGLALAWWALASLGGSLPVDVPRAGEVAMNARVLIAGLTLALAAGTLVGIAPIVVVLRHDNYVLLRGTGGAGAGPRGVAPRLLVTSEVALAVVLLVGAGLMLQTMWQLARVDPGFRPERVLTLGLQHVDPSDDADAGNRVYYGRVFAAVEAVPGVEAVGAVQHLPLGGTQWGADLEIWGRPLAPGATPPDIRWRLVAHDYFRAMGIPLRAGRLFSSADRPGGPDVVLVNESLARLLAERGPAIGQRVRAGSATEGRWATVVGIVGDVRHAGIRAAPDLEIYRPYAQQSGMRAMMLAVKTRADPVSLAPSIRTAIWSVDPNAPISGVRPMVDLVATSVAEPRTLTALLMTFAAVGLTLSVVGVGAVAAYGVSHRRRELGVRLALGATPRQMVRMVMADHCWSAIAGVVLGVAGALVLGRAMESLVYGVSAYDPASYLLLAGVVMAVATLASFASARRAARVDPFETLREG